MEEYEAGHHGFVVAVVIFWLLAAGLCGTAFVLHQATEHSRLRTEALKVEQRQAAEDAIRLEREVDKLRATLDSDASTDQAAIDFVRQAVGETSHIDGALTAADARTSDLQGHVAVLNATKTDLEQQLTRAQEERKAADATLTAKITQIEGRISGRTAQVNQRVSQLSAQLAALTSSIDDLESRIKSERDIMRKDLIDFQSGLKILLAKRQESKNQLRLTLEFRPPVVGQVIGADMALNFAFVSLGRQHGLREGMRFGVYGPDTVFRPHLKPKAVLEITRLGDERSQARVSKQNLGDPVVTGDVLVNIAFDPEGRKPTFVLIRFLDIDGDNVDDRDDLIKIIQGQGGEVLPPDASYVDVNTDFILIGEEWGAGETLPFERDQAIMGKAARRSVTQLDVETFLNYIGHPKWK